MTDDATVQAAPYTAFARVYDQVMQDIEYDDWVDFLLLELLERGFSGGRVLDLACGTGNSTLPFHRRGLDVTGMDAAPMMLEVARTKQPEIEWLEGEFVDFRAPGKYGLVTSIFDAVNNLLTHEDFSRMARRVLEHLEPGGFLAFDVNTSHGLRELWDQGGISGWAGDTWYAWDYRYDEQSGIATVEAGFATPEGSFIEKHQELKYDRPELERLLADAGYVRVDVIEFPDGNDAPEDSHRVWVIAQAA